MAKDLAQIAPRRSPVRARLAPPSGRPATAGLPLATPRGAHGGRGDHPTDALTSQRHRAPSRPFRVIHMLLVAATVLGPPWALRQSLEKRLRRRSRLSAGGWLIGARGLRLWKKLFRIPEVDMESFDLFNEHQDRAAGRGHLF